MKVKLKRPIRVNCLSGEVEVTQQEYERLLRMGAIEVADEREIPEKQKRTTRKAK